MISMPVRVASCLFLLALTANAVDLPNKIDGMETTYEVLAEGEGKAVSKSDTVTVHATGIVKETGKKFWSTKDAGQQPFTYQAGVNKVIKGWDQGVVGMLINFCLTLGLTPVFPAPSDAVREGYKSPLSAIIYKNGKLAELAPLVVC